MNLSDLSTGMLKAAKAGHLLAARDLNRRAAEPHYAAISDINKVIGPREGHVNVCTLYTKEVADYETAMGWTHD